MAEPGQRVGRYVLRRKLGAGGAGEVWEAILEGRGGFARSVALKLLAGGPGDARDALVHEARLGALLAHPNLVSVYELGEADGAWFFAMELVHGVSLAELGRDRPLSGAAVLDVGIQACAGLAHLHGLVVDGKRAGLVHRDVKRANLIVDASGLVKLADLGIARFSGSNHLPGGTPGYMAPEQVAGGEDARADLFALGVVLYTMVTGRRPFGGGVGALQTVLHADEVTGAPGFFEPVAARAPGLAEVLRRCLRARPDERWSSAAELGAALAALVRGQKPGRTLLDELARVRAATTGSAPAGSLGRVAPLPRPRGAFLGRDDDVHALADAITRGAARWVTLVGAPGVGKSRLAVEVAAACRARGLTVWYADLGAVHDDQGLVGAVGRALGLAEADAPRIGGVLAHTGAGVLVLDDADRVAWAPHVLRWLREAPGARVLVAGGPRVGDPAEHVHEVGPLATPDAVALLAARCERTLSDGERAIAARLVDRLDRLPLAVELAAARAATAPLPEVLAGLDRHLDWARDDPAVPERQRSLRATLDASWDLLGPGERAALAQLSVFVDGFGLEAAEAVVEPPPGAPWVLDLLEALTARHLVAFDPDRERFRLAAAVRAHAGLRAGPGELAQAEVRHGRWFAQLGTVEALDALRRRGGTARLTALDADLENLVAAAERAVARGDRDVAPGAALAACAILSRRGPYARCAELAGAARALAGPREAARLLLVEARARQGTSVATALALLDEAVALAFAHDDPHVAVPALVSSGYARQFLGRPLEARAAQERALAVARSGSDRGDEAAALVGLGMLERYEGRMDHAEPLLREAWTLNQALGHEEAARHAQHNLAVVLVESGRVAEGRALQEAALRAHRVVGDRALEGNALGQLAAMSVAAGDLTTALALGTASLEVFRSLGDRRQIALKEGFLGGIWLERGRLEEARPRLERAVALAQLVPDPRVEGAFRAELAQVLRREGRLAEAVAEVDRAEALLAPTRGDHVLALVDEERVHQALARDDLAAARAHLASLERRVPPGDPATAARVARLKDQLGG